MSAARIRYAWFFSACLAAASSAQAVDLIGYLPHYRMNSNYVANFLPGQLEMLDEVRYFGLTVDSNGVIVPLANSLQTHLNNIATIQNAIDNLPAASQPRLSITLGAAGQDVTFTNVAASAAKRDVFAQNIDSLLDQTQAAGVDIDWEHPDAGVQRTVHYPAMLQRIKEEVGSDRRVYATVAPSVMIPSTVFAGPNGIDGASLMVYDLGWWSNDPNNPNNGEHSLQEYAEDTVEAWTEPFGSPNDRPWVFGTWGNNAPAENIGVALPFYGRSLSNQAAYTYAELVSGGSTTDGEYYQYFGQQVWTASPELAAERVEYAAEQGLDHVIIWEIGQDVAPTSSASLLKAAFDAKQALAGLPGDFNGDGSVDAADFTVWRDGLDVEYSPAQYAEWATNFGADSGTAQAVPEPSAGLVAALACCLGTLRSRAGAACDFKKR